MTKRCIAGVTLALSLLLVNAADRPREQKYQQAVDLLESKGDVKGAIKLFEEVAKSPDRNLAARSLLYLGSCYEKLGQDGARKAYQRIVREFGDQADVTAKARGRLSALGTPAERGIVAQRVWASSPTQSDRGHIFGSLVSRDGRYLSFLDYENDSINVKDTVTGEERMVLKKASPEDRTFNWVNVSPDGKKLAYCSSYRVEPAQLHVVAVDGSNPRLLGEGCPRDWSPDGKQILAFRSGTSGPKIDMVSVTDGSSAPIISRAFSASFSPDGRYIAFIRMEQGREGSIFVVPAGGGLEVQMVDGRNKDVAWASDGKSLLFVSYRRGGRDLWSIPVAEGKPSGPPEIVREHVETLVGVTRDGDVYYENWREISDIYTADIDPQSGKLASRPRRITTTYINCAPAWSPDGESLVYYSQRGPVNWYEASLTIVVRNMKTGEERTVPLKSGGFLGPYHPYWFPDGRSLFAQTFRPGRLLQIDLQTGEGRQLNSVQLLPAPIGIQTAALAPDGRAIYYLALNQKADQTRVLVRNLDGSGERELFRAKSVGVPAVSPDHSRLAVLATSERGGWALFTVPAGGGQATELYRQPDRSLMPNYRYPLWSKDGKHIFLATKPPKGKASGEIWSIAVDGGEAQPLGIGLNELADLDLHPDGKQLVFTDNKWRDEIWVLKNLFNGVRASR